MHIRCRSKDLEELCCDTRSAKKVLGKQCASILAKRLDEMRWFLNLADRMKLKAGRCHELIADRKGQFSVDLQHPKRLIFEPDHDPVPTKIDGGIDLARVTHVVITEIADTHS